MNLPLQRSWLADLLSAGVERVGEPGDVRGECVMGRRDILTEVHATTAKMRQHLLESHDLLFGLVSAVVDDDVDSGHLPAQRLPECAVGLVADEDPRALVLICFAGRLDVDAVDMTAGPEVRLPHVEASAAVHADLHEVNFLADELAEVTL